MSAGVVGGAAAAGFPAIVPASVLRLIRRNRPAELAGFAGRHRTFVVASNKIRFAPPDSIRMTPDMTSRHSRKVCIASTLFLKALWAIF